MNKKNNIKNMLLISIFGIVAMILIGNIIAQESESSPGFNKHGNVLITDQFNNRVIEVDPNTNQIVWSFGSNDPTNGVPGPNNVPGTNWAERIGRGMTLIAGTGIPAGVDPALPSGAVDNRVIIVNQSGDIIWQYGQAGVTGSSDNELNVPVSAIQLPNGNILITDQGNNRIIEVDFKTKDIAWSFGPTSGPGELNSPNSAELLNNGNFLIADENNNRVIEITPNGKIVWQYDVGNAAAFASRLPNGNTLITDAGDSRILIVNKKKKIVFEYFTNDISNSNSNPTPTNAVQLRNGNIVIADQFNDRSIQINKNKQIVWQYGMTNVVGNGTNELNGPYTSFVIGDYTGQTRPPMNFRLN